jgi:catechol 2,3-dioxygenase-like lactoylglutathione lyase family enzyme
MVIKEIVLQTGFPDELQKFYADTLGLNLKYKDDDSFDVQFGDSVLKFTKVPGKNKPFYHFAFNIPENQFKEAKEWAKQRVDLIKLDGEDEFDFKSWNAHSIYFYDPSGNILELIARNNLSNKSSEQFSGKSFLNISEIGLPVYDIENFYFEVNRNFDIPIFSGDTKNFCAAGDDEGLFIIVNNGRKWFPDCPDAEIFPTAVKIKSYFRKEIEFENLPYKIISVSE